jgi:hypothetical protein
VLLGFTASLLFKMAVKVSLGQAITFGALMTFIGVKSTLVGPTSLSN